MSPTNNIVTPAEEMEAEERELVITESVEDVIEHADHHLSDAEIEEKSLSEDDILPDAQDDKNQLIVSP